MQLVGEDRRSRELAKAADRDRDQQAALCGAGNAGRDNDRGELGDQRRDRRLPPKCREKVRAAVDHHGKPRVVDTREMLGETKPGDGDEQTPGEGEAADARSHPTGARTLEEMPRDQHNRDADARHRHDRVHEQRDDEASAGDPDTTCQHRRHGC